MKTKNSNKSSYDGVYQSFYIMLYGTLKAVTAERAKKEYFESYGKPFVVCVLLWNLQMRERTHESEFMGT